MRAQGLYWNEAHLHVAFCDVERGNAGVSETAGNGAAEHALGVVGGIVRDGAKVPVPKG